MPAPVTLQRDAAQLSSISANNLDCGTPSITTGSRVGTFTGHTGDIKRWWEDTWTEHRTSHIHTTAHTQ